MTVLSRHKFFATALAIANFGGLPLASAANNDFASTYWRGGYFGPAFSLHRLNNTYNPIAPGGIQKLKANGKLIGVMGGYNFLHKDFMWGIEGDINAGSVFNDNLSYITTLRGRIGKPFNYSLPFVTGGLALARIKQATTLSPFKTSDIQAGLVIGGGFEQVLAQAITGRLEYTYGHFFSNSSGGPNVQLSNIHMFRASIAIHFRD